MGFTLHLLLTCSFMCLLYEVKVHTRLSRLAIYTTIYYMNITCVQTNGGPTGDASGDEGCFPLLLLSFHPFHSLFFIIINRYQYYFVLKKYVFVFFFLYIFFL